MTCTVHRRSWGICTIYCIYVCYNRKIELTQWRNWSLGVTQSYVLKLFHSDDLKRIYNFLADNYCVLKIHCIMKQANGSVGMFMYVMYMCVDFRSHCFFFIWFKPLFFRMPRSSQNFSCLYWRTHCLSRRTQTYRMSFSNSSVDSSPMLQCKITKNFNLTIYILKNIMR